MITNTSDISLALAVWLLYDEYDYIDQPNYISATSLMRPLRQILLNPQVKRSDRKLDVADFIPRALGNSIHNSIEKAWTHGYVRALKLMGYPDSVIQRIQINPEDFVLEGEHDLIPIYIEQRAFRKIDGYLVGGKFDLVTDGVLQDAKSTSAFTWVMGGKDDDYQLQGSLYRWIDAAQSRPKITEDYIRINFIFTDWQRNLARSNPKYPQKRIEYRDIPLLSLEETEAWVRSKLNQVSKHQATPENLLPECSDEELWLTDPVYKYYADPANTKGRATKNFDDLAEAMAFKATKGKGVVVTIPGEPKRCSYCEALSICSQGKRYFNP